MYFATACSIALAIHFQPGAHVVERSSYDDQTAWVLPPDRLAAFARGGAVINEDIRTTIIVRATVSVMPHGLETLNGILFKTIADVPRHRTRHIMSDLNVTVTPRNEPLPARMLDLEEAGMAELPTRRLCVGQSWHTRLPVMTTLGSGVADFVHTVTAQKGDLVEIDVKGFGVISGSEYNLPHLLPGSMKIHGTAWFDRSTGLVTQESYLVHNRLLRTVKRKSIGFIETETVDESARRSGRNAR
jgi:hypothetical protein